jgi:hypothetical protein
LNESSDTARKTAIATLEIQRIRDERSADERAEGRFSRPRRGVTAVVAMATYISAPWGPFAEIFYTCLLDRVNLSNYFVLQGLEQ